MCLLTTYSWVLMAAHPIDTHFIIKSWNCFQPIDVYRLGKKHCTLKLMRTKTDKPNCNLFFCCIKQLSVTTQKQSVNAQRNSSFGTIPFLLSLGSQHLLTHGCRYIALWAVHQSLNHLWKSTSYKHSSCSFTVMCRWFDIHISVLLGLFQRAHFFCFTPIFIEKNKKL